ncbi:hypothetical protein [Anaerofustis sp.]|uniref:hypothetical protein n=1 Tax=Anaerofustis sp. TaxID=1872517 RepID=UPI0025B9903E|nr:hypothetical protein [Anaerofustis sp.]
MKKKTVLIMVTIIGITLVGASVFAKEVGMNHMVNPLENKTNLTNDSITTTSDTQTSEITSVQVASVRQDDESKNKIDVNFKKKVIWDNNISITVTDANGNSYNARITDKDDDDMEFYVDNIKDGQSYTVTIQGIKAYNENAFSSLKINFETKKQEKSVKSNLKVKDVDFDREDREVSFDFDKLIKAKSNAYIVIKDSNGNTYSDKNSYLICDEDDIELFLDKNLTQGKKYTYSIYGVTQSGSNSYKTITGSFTAWDD